MPLNYQFYNNVTQDVKDEIYRREKLYWPSGHVSNDALAWNYQKTAYMILTALKVTPKSVAYNSPASTVPPLTPALTTTKPPRPDWRSATVGDYQANAIASKPVTIEKSSEVITRITTPNAPILDLYGPNYTNSTGTLRGAVLTSATIGVEGTYGSILRIIVNFTVFDKDELDKYMNNFLRPGVDIGLEYGWTVNEKLNVNTGNITGTVFNFSFAANEDGSWQCTLHAFGPSAMTYGFNVDAKDAENTTPDPSNYKTYGLLELFRSVVDQVDDLYTNGELITGGAVVVKKVYASQAIPVKAKNDSTYPYNPDKKEGPIFYIYNLPSEFSPASSYTSYGNQYAPGGTTTGTGAKITNSKPMAYITLGNLVELLNSKINAISKRYLPTYEFLQDGVNICVGTGLNERFLQTGPADSSKFGFTTQRNGALGSAAAQSSLSLRGTSESFSGQLTGPNIALQNLILINVQFIVEELQKIISGDKNVQNKKLTSFLNLLFAQIETETGGIIDLTLIPNRDSDGNIISILIQNKNGDPDNASTSITPFSIPMMTKNSVVRAMNIESKIPDAIVTEVATYTRAGLSYGEEEQIDVKSSNDQKKILLDELLKLNTDYLTNLAGTDTTKTSSINQWRTSVRNIYRRLASIESSLTLNSDGSIQSINNIMDLKTAVFPISYKVTLDGINGFLYGNAITTNWLPKQYRDDRVYWTVKTITHTIQNNDWTTELEAIYRVKEVKK